MNPLVAESTALPKADSGLRLVAFIIDSLIAFPIGAIGLIPIIGQLVSTVLLVPYWLLRDVGGASIGKRICGLRVVDRSGRIAPLGKRIKRNMLFGFAVVLMAIPVLGEFAAPAAFLIVCILEFVLMSSRGERMGDREAGCLVVKKSALMPRRGGALEHHARLEMQ